MVSSAIIDDMARKLDSFPDEPSRSTRRYPWHEWTDGSPWEIRRGEDYETRTENMRVNLHVRADAVGMKVRTRKVHDEAGEGLVFQFYDPVGREETELQATMQQDDLSAALKQLYHDALDIYERAREEVTIPRSDGTRQKYAAIRYKQQIERAWANDELVPAVARIIRRRTTGFDHLEAAGRHDLMVENLVLDSTKSYHRLFTETTKETARRRMNELQGN
jgi:hypothetical protein